MSLAVMANEVSSVRVDPRALPGDERTLVQFDFRGAPAQKGRWWLLFDHGEAELCLSRPGYDVDLTVRSHIKLMVDVWMGRHGFREALRAGDIHLEGGRALVRSFPAWFRLSGFA